MGGGYKKKMGMDLLNELISSKAMYGRNCCSVYTNIKFAIGTINRAS